jgi:uncharacterized protein YkwD
MAKLHSVIGPAAAIFAASMAVASISAPEATADNKRLNQSLISNVYTVQRQAGCTSDLYEDPALRMAAQWHTNDLMGNRALNGDLGSDGTAPQDRARDAGFVGRVAQTVAINPALAISGVELINRWYHDAASLAIMRNCDYTRIGVWSENSLDRTVVVAVYGYPM